MILECGVIIVLITVMAYFMLRTGKSGYALGVIPLTLVPAFHIASGSIATLLMSYFSIGYVGIRIAIDLIALVTSCLLIGGVSLGIKKVPSRVIFLLVCGSFSVMLTCILILDMI